jgi:four helix bundle protein
MAVIKSFRELEVYRRASHEAKILFMLTNDFPKEEMFSLTNQIRRSSRAVCALLAESWARRRYQAAFVNKLNEALGEAMETQAWLDHALACECISVEKYQELDNAWQHIGAMLHRMIQRAADFRKQLST